MRRSKGQVRQRPPGQPRIARIGAQPLLGAERQVTLDRQAQPAAHRRQLAQADPADFRLSQARVAKTEGAVVVVGINLGQQPGRAGVRREQLDHGRRIEVRVLQGCAAVGQQHDALLVSDECVVHGELLKGCRAELPDPSGARRSASSQGSTTAARPQAPSARSP